jgi:hypothetical protein
MYDAIEAEVSRVKVLPHIASIIGSLEQEDDDELTETDS